MARVDPVGSDGRDLAFGRFRFVRSSGRLYRDGLEIHLTPKATGVLRLLLERPGEVIGKDEFLAAVWPGVHVRDEALTQAISAIRRAVGDTSHDPDFIQTVPGAGYRFIGEVSAWKESSSAAPATGGNPTPASLPAPRAVATATARWSPWLLAATMTVIAAAATLTDIADAPHTDEIQRWSIALPADQPIIVASASEALWGLGRRYLAFSPEGKRVAYEGGGDGGRRAFLREHDRFRATPIEGTEGATNLFFAPDGQWVGMVVDGRLQKVPVAGGAAQTLSENAGAWGADWRADDMIVFTRAEASGLSLVPAAGTSPPSQLTAADGVAGERGHLWPVSLPDGRHVLYTIRAHGGSLVDSRLAVVSLESGDRKIVVDDAAFGTWVPSGHLAFLREGKLYAQRFDIEQLEVTGDPMVVAEIGRGTFTVSAAGHLAFVPMLASPVAGAIVWVDRNGEEIRSTRADPAVTMPRVSPDGSHVAVASTDAEGAEDIWVYDLEQATTPLRLTFAGDNAWPVWEPNGQWITFASQRQGSNEIFRVRADGTGTIQPVFPGHAHPYSWHPTGRALLFESDETMRPSGAGPTGDGTEIWIYEPAADPQVRPLVTDIGNQTHPMFSPDGRWLAYASDETGEPRVFVQRYPELDHKYPITPGFGRAPLWSPDGGEIYYRGNGCVMAVAVDTESGFRSAQPVKLFETPDGYHDFHLSPGGRFVFTRLAGADSADEIKVVLNWSDELSRRLPAER